MLTKAVGIENVKRCPQSHISHGQEDAAQNN
jgi:hypothetical protein